MFHFVTDGLYKPPSDTEVSQAVKVAPSNAVQFVVWLRNATEQDLAGFSVSLDVSDDLENWETLTSASTGSITTTPSTTYAPATPIQLVNRFARLRFQGGTRRLVVSAALRTYELEK